MAATRDAKLTSCEVCGAEDARYTCPKCEVRTCCLACVRIHKKELECDGIRDRTKFLPIREFTDLDLLSDYRLLEEVSRSVDAFQRDPSKRYTRQNTLPVHLNRLKSAAYQRKTILEFLPQHFSQHKANTTYYMWKSNQLFWRVEWIFPQAENLKHVDNRVLESERLSTILERIINPLDTEGMGTSTIEEITSQVIRTEKLQYYRASSLSSLKVLLKAERVINRDSKFYELDLTTTLRENLEGKYVIEFPVLYVILKDHSDMYEIIETDDEEEMPALQHHRKGFKRHHTSDQENKKKKSDGVPKNFFFDTDLTDSENEAGDEAAAKTSRHDI